MHSDIPRRLCVVLPPEGAARQVGEQIIAAMQQMPQISLVTVFDCKTYLSAFDRLLKNPTDELTVDLMGNALAVQCFDARVDAVLILALSPVTLFLLNVFKKNNIKTAHWFYEDFAKATYWKEVVSGYDLFCAIQHGPIETECVATDSRYLFLPTATSLTTRPVEISPEFDVSFVGIPSAYRISVLESLANAGISLTIAGEGWNQYTGILQKHIAQGTWTSAEDSIKIICSSRIGINLSYTSPFENPEHVHISPRVYDVCGCGRVLLTEDVPLLPLSCTELDYNTFASASDALSVAKTILNDYNTYLSKAQKNISVVFSIHSYQARIALLLAHIQQSPAEPHSPR